MISLRKMDYEEDFLERAEKKERERKSSAMKNDELIRNMFIEEKSYNYGSNKNLYCLSTLAITDSSGKREEMGQKLINSDHIEPEVQAFFDNIVTGKEMEKNLEELNVLAFLSFFFSLTINIYHINLE